MRKSVSPTRRRFDEDHLLDAALEVFHADGYSAAQTADVAQRAGTTRPTLHSRLGNKDDIYLRVVQREAHTIQEWIFEAYERGRTAPLDELADIGMAPVFRFARERRQGFDLVFRGDRTGDRPATLRREVIANVTAHLTALIEHRELAYGPIFGPNAATLASACIGVALQVCEYALDHDRDLAEAHQLAAAFVAGAFRQLDVARRGTAATASSALLR